MGGHSGQGWPPVSGANADPGDRGRVQRKGRHCWRPRMRDGSASPTPTPQRPVIQRQISMSASDDENTDTMLDDTLAGQDRQNNAPLVPTTGLDIEQLGERASLVEREARGDETFLSTVTGVTDMGTFNIHNEAIDANIIEQIAAGQENGNVAFSPTPQFQNEASPVPATNDFARPPPVAERGANHAPTRPAEHDIMMSLQLLAYVSKYCHLRSYFNNSHLVPRLKSENEAKLLSGDEEQRKQVEQEADDEYCQDSDTNIFPLVEKFTLKSVRSKEIRYWACVVMRNLCRKDKLNGDIRQCANYKCGKWEEYPRQFAKCRRCRQTKYCSKECQKSAWFYHR